MENNKLVIIGLLLIIIVLLSGILVFVVNTDKQEAVVETNNTTVVEENNPVTPDRIMVELPEFDRTYTETAGEYTVEAVKWMGTSVGGFEVSLYKNGEPVYKDSYLSRAYFYMDGEWKWSEWGNGEDDGGNHKYPVGNDVEIQKVEVKF